MTVVSGHQPAYLPWLGLLHKASLCDVFVFMDDVQFLDRDFNHRNRILAQDNRVQWLTVPVDRKNSPSRLLKDTAVAQDGPARGWQHRHLLALKSCYGATPHFGRYLPFFEWLYLENRWESLAALNLAILRQALEWFGLAPRLVKGSDMGFSGRKSDLVLEHALRLDADTVVTGALGRDYIRLEDFAARGVKVVFQDYRLPAYLPAPPDEPAPLSFVDLLFREGPRSPQVAFAGNTTREDL
jgi:hypothetical protein